MSKLPEELGQIASGLDRLKEVQRFVSAQVPDYVTEEVTNDQVARTCFALTGEIFELAQKLGWKTWKVNPEFDDEQVEAIAEEYADILAWQGLLTLLVCERTGLTPKDLESAYWAKTEKNLRRFEGTSGEAGYIGVDNVDRWNGG
jgi:NTP pyrophosphatase (non-canonical NTP hydrolase)